MKAILPRTGRIQRTREVNPVLTSLNAIQTAVFASVLGRGALTTPPPPPTQTLTLTLEARGALPGARAARGKGALQRICIGVAISFNQTCRIDFSGLSLVNSVPQ